MTELLAASRDSEWGPGVTAVPSVTRCDMEGWADHATLLDDVQRFLERFIAYPSPEAATAHALWIAHAHLIEAFENTPRLAFLSPEPGSGKSRCMELTEALVPRPVLSVNATVAYIFRKISDEAGKPTLLMDEIDAVFSGGHSTNNEDLRGLLNSGYRKGATAGRAAIRGKEIVTEEWPSFAAVALAGLNQLPDTLMTRSIVIPMKRRPPEQRLESYRRRVNGPAAAILQERLAEFASEVGAQVTDVFPDLPEGIEDRDADIWEPLLAIADAVGGHWPDTARAAAIAMVGKSKEKPATLGVQLLADIRVLLGDRDRITTAELLDGLHGLETSPWGSIKGQPIDSRFLARTLSKYEIPTNNTIRAGAGSAKGYMRHHFTDAFERYLPPITSVTSVTDSADKGGEGNGQHDLNQQNGKSPDSVILHRDRGRGEAMVSVEIGNKGYRGNTMAWGNGHLQSNKTDAEGRPPFHPGLLYHRRLRLRIITDVVANPGTPGRGIRTRLNLPAAKVFEHLRYLTSIEVLTVDERGRDINTWRYTLSEGIDPDALTSYLRQPDAPRLSRRSE